MLYTARCALLGTFKILQKTLVSRIQMLDIRCFNLLLQAFEPLQGIVLFFGWGALLFYKAINNTLGEQFTQGATGNQFRIVVQILQPQQTTLAGFRGAVTEAVCCTFSKISSSRRP